jgi:DNA-binding NarL/FixJ family response regulator
MPSKVATRSSLEQVAIIDAMLARPSGASVGELVERLGCCEKTVKRHVWWMRRKFNMRIAIVGWGRGLNRRWVYPTGQASIFTREATRRLA